jgi:hypothetical protein
MHFILLAFLLNVQTGQPTSMERIGAPFGTPEACVQAQTDQPIQKAAEGHIKVFICVREDQLHETTT